jgi:transglutaminase-like putative cysteine protease
VTWDVSQASSALLLVQVADRDAVHDETLEVTGGDVEHGPQLPPRSRPFRITTTGDRLEIVYRAEVADPANPAASDDPSAPLPDAAHLDIGLLPWTWPSRYCPSDLVAGTATALFGDAPRQADLLDAVTGWVRDHIAYVSGVSDHLTAADETLLTRQGVCRDLAHVTVAFLRALDIPARVTACYALELEPPDFHAVVEAHDGQRWRLLDATGLAPVSTLVPIATGRDAAEVAWAATGPGLSLDQLNVEVARA